MIERFAFPTTMSMIALGYVALITFILGMVMSISPMRSGLMIRIRGFCGIIGASLISLIIMPEKRTFG